MPAVNGPDLPEDTTTGSDEQRRHEALGRLAAQRLGEDVPPLSSQPLPVSERPAFGKRPVRRRRTLVIGASVLVGCVLLAATAVWAARQPRSSPVTAPQGQTQTPSASVYNLAGGGACVQLGNHPQPPYANIQVTHDTALAHSEPMLVQDPTDPLHLVGGSKFFTDPSRYRFQIGTVTSFDGGCSWSDGGFLSGFGTNALVSDPSFAFGAHGQVYAAVLFAPADAQSGASVGSGVAMYTSHDGGRAFGAPVQVYRSPTLDIFNDKPWIAVDQTSGPRQGTIYVLWSYDHGGECGYDNFCSQEAAFSRSTDGGKTFSALRLIEGEAPFCTNPAAGRSPDSRLCDGALGVLPVVAPDGTLTVAFAYENLVDSTQPTRLLIISSHDGGDTWTAPSLVATVTDVFGVVPPARFRTVTLPALACDPATGQLYMAWSARDQGEDDIFFATSRDGGGTWSPPRRVNDDTPFTGAAHVQPQIAVAPHGVVTVMFFDSRLDLRHRLLDVYIAQSHDRGASFLRNVRVTTRGFDPAVGAPVDGGGNLFLGDYQGLAVTDQFVHPLWNDTRTGRQELFTAAIPSAQPDARTP